MEVNPGKIGLAEISFGEMNFLDFCFSKVRFYMLMFFPAFLVLAIIQRWFMRGLTAGGIKF